MLFNSYIFIFIFLPLVLSGWYTLNHFKAYKLSLIFLSGMSLWFYAYFNLKYLLIITASCIVNYILSLLMNKCARLRIFCCISGVIFNLGLLFYYKYYDFFIDNINIVFGKDYSLKNIILPLGISFFTFQQLSYVIDRYKGLAKHYSFVEYLAYITFFPQLVAGPIVMYDELLPQFNDVDRRSFCAENFVKGLCIFSIGLSKKVLLADVLGNLVNIGYAEYELMDSFTSVLVVILYACELYFDFSGYSDMAVGLGRMFNIELPKNFISPYKQSSMKKMWQNWHITLSRFLFRYIYIPLGGNRKGTLRTYINIFVVFFVSGLWHGANWTFVIWGILQGIAVIWNNIGLIGTYEDGDKGKPVIVIPKLVGCCLTFAYYALTLVFFRSDNISTAIRIFKNIIRFNYTGYFIKFINQFDIPEIYIIKQAVNMVAPGSINIVLGIIVLGFALFVLFLLTRRNTFELLDKYKTKTAFYIGCALLMTWSIISFSQVSTFIYFNF